MKNNLLLIAIVLLAACDDTTDNPKEDIVHFYAPAPGTIVAADSTPIEEDDLNDFYYSVRITATDSSAAGYYQLDAIYGVNEAHTKVIYPKLDRQVHPAIRPDTIPYSYIVGFHFSGSDTFKDYARVSASKIGPMNRQIEVRYIKAYFMDSTKK